MTVSQLIAFRTFVQEFVVGLSDLGSESEPRISSVGSITDLITDGSYEISLV